MNKDQATNMMIMRMKVKDQVGEMLDAIHETLMNDDTLDPGKMGRGDWEQLIDQLIDNGYELPMHFRAAIVKELTFTKFNSPRPL